MSSTGTNQGSRAAYDFWLGLISQFLSPIGGASPAGTTSSVPEGLPYPVDQIAKSAVMTQQFLQGMSQLLEPALKAGLPDLLTQWAKPLAAFASSQSTDAAKPESNSLFAPWLAYLSNTSAALPMASAFTPGASAILGQSPLQSMNQAWVDIASRFTGTSPAQIDASFDRAYGALSDGVGMGPARKVYAAWRDVISATLAQQDARNHYVHLLQEAYARGYQRLLMALAAKGEAGERVDSVLALIRMWTLNTEQAVHETMQSEPGMSATAALIRSDLAYRKRMQLMAGVMADQFDMASRHELDEAFREIQALKRELRAMRPGDMEEPPRTRRAPTRPPAAAKKSGRAGAKKSSKA